MYSPSLRSWDSVLSVAISTRRVQSLSLRSLMDCVALPARVASGVTWWREGPWRWSGNGLPNGASTCSQLDDIGWSGCSRAPSCGTPPARDASPSDAGCSRGLPHSEVPDCDFPPTGHRLAQPRRDPTLRQAQPILRVRSGASPLVRRWSGHEAVPDRPPSVGAPLQL